MKKNNEEIKLFTNEELDVLLSGAILGGATDEECERLIRWAELTRVGEKILHHILTGKYIYSISGDGFPIHIGEREEEKKK